MYINCAYRQNAPPSFLIISLSLTQVPVRQRVVVIVVVVIIIVILAVLMLRPFMLQGDCPGLVEARLYVLIAIWYGLVFLYVALDKRLKKKSPRISSESSACHIISSFKCTFLWFGFCSRTFCHKCYHLVLDIHVTHI